MANNCLKTKLKGVVNSDLPVFGKIKTVYNDTNPERKSLLIYGAENGMKEFLDNDGSMYISADNGAEFWNYAENVKLDNPLLINKSLLTMYTMIKIRVPNGTTNVTWDKYITPYLRMSDYAPNITEDIHLCTNLKNINLVGTYWDLNDLPESIETFVIGKITSGSLSRFPNLKSVGLINGAAWDPDKATDASIVNDIPATLEISFNINGGFKGDILAFKKLVNCKGMALISNPLMTGSLDEVFDYWATNGKNETIPFTGGGMNSLTLSSKFDGKMNYSSHNIKFENGDWNFIS